MNVMKKAGSKTFGYIVLIKIRYIDVLELGFRLPAAIIYGCSINIKQ